MNRAHNWICASARWRTRLQQRGLPWALAGLDLGSDVVELGPGFGASTDFLRQHVGHLTCVEIHRKLAASLARRTLGANVTVLHEDATHTSLPSASFDSVLCIMMLHHIPSPALQDRLFAEAFRVLRPGGLFAGHDGLNHPLFRLVHLFDTYTPLDPVTLPGRLDAAGFAAVEVQTQHQAMRFRARKPL